jgi:hypothetical protein
LNGGYWQAKPLDCGRLLPLFRMQPAAPSRSTGADSRLSRPRAAAGGRAIANNEHSYRILEAHFKALRPEFDRAGFEVFNCNPDSRLQAFPFTDLEAAVEEVTATLDTGASTEGMYVDRRKGKVPSSGL